MKITDVQGFTVELPAYQFYSSDQKQSFREWTLVKVSTDADIYGYAMCPRGAIARDVVHRIIKPLAVGENALLKEKLWQKMWHVDRSEQIPNYTFSMLDICLWDITAKAAGMPLYQLLGGTRDKIPAYASTVCYRDIAEFLDVADQSKARGFHGLKLHAFQDARKDAKLALALRAHVGDDYPLMYDASGIYSYADAVYLGRALEEAGFAWFEEPMNENSISSYKRLCDELTIPILAGEMSQGKHYNAADFIVSGAADIIRVNVRNKGGFTGALRIAHFADSLRMNAEVHGGELIQLQLALAIPNTSMLESIIYSNPIVNDEPIDAEGYAHAPEHLGIGYDPEWLKHLEATSIAWV
ncbi:enolase C-terminal domain-like protein [Paenibacillus roseipurpureus]|uniref:Enolase C-terminal domain-like protein n=1 Tax=Paenibacillus roseopurpureus TaxID=2918901 RepID=A0AA96LMX9_9BACL|nr:enolase C-terminal domain-like protein [Paenibacillus sp. MBLB1832]WNR43496.1 enolase C-terminal domain-like protein [Paenibacillus sp. MBLB1832]